MFNRLDFMIALRYLRSKKTESFISVVSLFSLLGIALGVAALIIVMAVMNGFRIELTKKIISFDGDIGIYSKYGEITDYQNLVNNITNNKNIVSAYPMIQKQVLVSSGKDSTYGAQVRGITIDDLTKKKLISDNIVYGKIHDFENDFTILIGQGLAFELNVGVGDFIKLISPESSKTIIGQLPRFKSFKVVGIFQAGMSEFDSITIFMSLKNAQNFFKMHNSINTIEVHTKNPQNSHLYKFEIMNFLNNDILINDWKSKNLTFFNALKTERVVMFLILTLIILVAAFNIISGLIMLVKDKTHDIAILRTMGIKRFAVVRIFFICGALLGLIGTIIGLILGISFAMHIEQIRVFLEKFTQTSLFNPLIYYLSELPSEIQLTDILMVTSIALSTSFGATIYPAWRAASIDPIKGLKI